MTGIDDFAADLAFPEGPVAFADGSVKFISQNIDLGVYRKLATIQGGVVVGEF